MDVQELLRAEGRLDGERAAALVARVAAALDAAHAQGLVHGGVRLENIRIESREGAEQVHLTGLGLTRESDAATATGAFAGTVDYIAPEQIRGERVDARADVYALGCVLFELLTGNPPFAAHDDDEGKMNAHLEEEPPTLRTLRPDLAPEMGEVVARALAKQPDDRYPSAGDLGRAAVAAARGEVTTEAERSVATGAAAPVHKPHVAAPTERMRERIESAEPPVPDAPPPVPPRRSMWILAVVAVGAAVVALLVYLLLSSG